MYDSFSKEIYLCVASNDQPSPSRFTLSYSSLSKVVLISIAPALMHVKHHKYKINNLKDINISIINSSVEVRTVEGYPLKLNTPPPLPRPHVYFAICRKILTDWNEIIDGQNIVLPSSYVTGISCNWNIHRLHKATSMLRKTDKKHENYRLDKNENFLHYALSKSNVLS